MEVDYSKMDLNIQQAMLDHVKRIKSKGAPPVINWGGLNVQTSDKFDVASRGVVTAEFISSNCDVEQGFDLSVSGGFELLNGERISCLRTWRNSDYEDVVSYPFISRDNCLYVWNVFKFRRADGSVIDSKWIGNSGFWVEHLSAHERIYHCSHGLNVAPDFESLVFRVQVS